MTSRKKIVIIINYFKYELKKKHINYNIFRKINCLNGSFYQGYEESNIFFFYKVFTRLPNLCEKSSLNIKS